jgi:cytoskeletal protein RodZ
MNPMDRMDDEFRDSDISSLLGRVGGDAPATNVAYQEVLGRVRRVRQRRTIAATLGATVAIVGIGAVVIQSGSRDSDRIALDPRSAVVTTPDGSMVTTPDGVVVTVITQPDDSTTVPSKPGDNSAPTSDPNPSTPTNAVTSTPTNSVSPGGVNRPTGSDDTTTTLAPTTTKPTPSTAPSTSKPTIPSVPVITRPTTPGTTPVVTRPSVPPSAPPTVDTITRACGAGAIKVDVVNKAFVVGSVQTVVLPGFQATITSAKETSIEARFTSAQGRVTATLKVRITGNAIKHDCDIEVEKKANNDDNDAGDESSDDNNGARADD